MDVLCVIIVDMEGLKLQIELTEIAVKMEQAGLLSDLSRIARILSTDDQADSLLEEIISHIENKRAFSSSPLQTVTSESKESQYTHLRIKFYQRALIRKFRAAFIEGLSEIILEKYKSQKKFAEAAGLKAASVSRILSTSGKSIPNQRTLKKFGNTLKQAYLDIPLTEVVRQQLEGIGNKYGGIEYVEKDE